MHHQILYKILSMGSLPIHNGAHKPARGATQGEGFGEGCEQKLGAEPSTQDRSGPIDRWRCAHNARGVDRSKGARLRALTCRGRSGRNEYTPHMKT